jgi:hypothetical protein
VLRQSRTIRHNTSIPAFVHVKEATMHIDDLAMSHENNVWFAGEFSDSAVKGGEIGTLLLCSFLASQSFIGNTA